MRDRTTTAPGLSAPVQGVYQRSIGAARQAINAAGQIRVRAERRMGEELRKAEFDKGGRPAETGRADRPVLDARNRRIFEMWMACYTTREIAEAVHLGKSAVDEICPETASLPKAVKPAASHLIDFDRPIYNVWKQQEKTAPAAIATARIPPYAENPSKNTRQNPRKTAFS